MVNVDIVNQPVSLCQLAKSIKPHHKKSKFVLEAVFVLTLQKYNPLVGQSRPAAQRTSREQHRAQPSAAAKQKNSGHEIVTIFISLTVTTVFSFFVLGVMNFLDCFCFINSYYSDFGLRCSINQSDNFDYC